MIDKSTFKCPTCKADQTWLEPFYPTIPEKCTVCGKPINLKGEITAANFIVKDGKIRHVFWYEWGDRDGAAFFEDLRSDLKLYDAPGDSDTDLVYDIDRGEIESQGNGHFNAVVVLIPRANRKTSEDERAARNALYARLRPISVDLLSMMHGRPYLNTDHNHLVSQRVDCVHPQEGATLKTLLERDEFMEEYMRRAAITKAWFEKLLGEPVEAEGPILWVAERWDALGRPKAEACVWNVT